MLGDTEGARSEWEFHAATPASQGGERSWSWAAVSLSRTTVDLATFRDSVVAKRARFLGSRCLLFYLRDRRPSSVGAVRQESGAAAVGEEA